MPKAIEGVAVSPAELAAAYGDERYLAYLDILHDVLLGEPQEPGQDKDVWYDADEVSDG